MNSQSLHRVLSSEALSNDAVPTILVSTKCDNPAESWEVDQDEIERFCSTMQGLETFQTCASAPETHKRCISVLLRNIMLGRLGMSSLLPLFLRRSVTLRELDASTGQIVL